jgi:hypothetical protein
MQLNDAFKKMAYDRAESAWTEYREAVRMADSPGDVKTAEKRLREVPSFSIPDMQRVYEDEIKRLKESEE